MTLCEKCWTDAYSRAIADTSKSQSEHYADLILERKDNLCVPVVIPLEPKVLAEALTEFLGDFNKYYNQEIEPSRLKQEIFIEVWARKFIVTKRLG